MKKVTVFLSIMLLVFSSEQLFSQTEPTDLPNLTPPSPEAFAITQYGNQEINESTGKARTSVPLYTYTAGKLEVPISLNYIGNGVKVNDVPTWTGMNWTLQAGGVITRTVYHKPDELAGERVFENELNIPSILANNQDAYYIHQIFNSSGNSHDTQPDIFNFSFAGYSGSFYLSHDTSNPEINFKPVLVNIDAEIKIDIVDAAGEETNNHKDTFTSFKHFRITTPDGVQYFFGLNAIETTFLDQLHHNVITPEAVTSFYLIEIKHPINGTVYFDYIDDGDYKIAVSESLTLNKYVPSDELGFYNCTYCPCAPPPACEPLQESNPQNFNSIKTYNNIKGGKFLSKIHSPNSPRDVFFNSTSVTNALYNYKRTLDNIEVKNGGNTLNKIELNYLFDSHNDITDRFFLKKIEFDVILDDTNPSHTSLSRKSQKYAFEYNDPLALPARFSTSQDALGYYNNKSNLDGLLPDSSQFPSGYGSPRQASLGLGTPPSIGIIATADRSSNFEFKSKGVLKKIYYPTGGHTLIEYEAPQEKEIAFKDEVVHTYRNNYPLEDGSGATYADDLTESIFLGVPTLTEDGFDENGYPFLDTNGLLWDQIITMQVTVEATDQAYHSNDRVWLRIYNVTSGSSVLAAEWSIDMTPEAGLNPDYIENRSFTYNFLASQDYEIRLSLTANSGGPSMKGTLRMTYDGGYQLVDGEGLRVKRISDFSSNTSVTNGESQNIKRYYYTNVENVFKNPTEYVGMYKEPKFYEAVTLLKECWEWDKVICPETGSLHLWQKDLFSASVDSHNGYSFGINPINYNEQIISNYNKVTISYGGDNFENGGVEKTFTKNISNVVLEEKSPRINTIQHTGILKTHVGAYWLSLDHGKLENEKALQKKGDTLYKLRNLKKTYQNETSSYLHVFVGSIFKDAGLGELYPSENVGLGKYTIHSKRNAIKDQIVTEYIDPFPVAWEGEQLQEMNPYLVVGWHLQDADGDGILNFEDADYLALIDSYDPDAIYDESNYRKVITTTNYEYNSYAGQPTKVITKTSKQEESSITENRYVSEAELDLLLGVSATDRIAYNDLRNAHIITSPIQVESSVMQGSIEKDLGVVRYIYGRNAIETLFVHKVQTVKGGDELSLEDRVIFKDYDDNGNLLEVKYKDGSITQYQYNGLNQVTRKIDNYKPAATSELPPEEDTTDINLCLSIQDAYPDSQVTYYNYDPVTNLLTSIRDPRCNVITYHYDSLYRLQYVKDADGNILNENEYRYTNQN